MPDDKVTRDDDEDSLVLEAVVLVSGSQRPLIWNEGKDSLRPVVGVLSKHHVLLRLGDFGRIRAGINRENACPFEAINFRFDPMVRRDEK